jgi:hypothetical protein
LRQDLATVQAELTAQQTRMKMLRTQASNGTEQQHRDYQFQATQDQLSRLAGEVRRREEAAEAAVAEVDDPRLTPSPEIARLNHNRAEEHRELAVELQQKTEEISKMKRLAIVFAITIVAVVAGGIALALILSPSESTSEPEATATAACSGTLTTEQAKTCIGMNVTVRGIVANSGDVDDTVYLNLDAPFPDPDRFVVVVTPSTESWGERQESRSIEVTGVVEYVADGILGIEAGTESAVRLD